MSSIRKERHTRIDKKGRIVIPASFRRALGVKSSEVVVLRPENDQFASKHSAASSGQSAEIGRGTRCANRFSG
jgi:AbrB family looped-hinge helix DNA binding protein